MLKELDVKDKKKRDEAAFKFEKACGKSGINFSIHRDKNIALQDLKHQSIFTAIQDNYCSSLNNFYKEAQNTPLKIWI